MTAAAPGPAPPGESEHELFIAGPSQPPPGCRSSAAPGPPEPPVSPPPDAPAEPFGEGGPPAAPAPARRNPRLLFAVAGVAIALVVAAVVLLAGGGGDDNGSSGSGGTKPVVATKLPADLAWRPVANPPFQRQYAASTSVGGKIWVFGGIGRKSSSTTTKVYDPATETWTQDQGRRPRCTI